MQTSNSATFTFELKTYTSSAKTTQIGDGDSGTAVGTISPTGRAPTLSAGNISYIDSNSITKDLTDDDDQIIKNYSNLLVSLNSKATANKGAEFNADCYSFTMSGYATQYASNTDTIPIQKTFNACSNSQFAITVVDSRGNSTPCNITVSDYYNYTKPSISSFTVERTNPALIGTTVNLSVSGTFDDDWLYAVSNTIITARYRYREQGGSYGSYSNIALTTGSGTFNYSGNISGTFVEDIAYEFEIEIVDKLDSVITTTNVPTITPTMDIDTDQRLTAFGMMGSVESPGVQAVNYFTSSGSLLVPPGMSFEWNSKHHSFWLSP